MTTEPPPADAIATSRLTKSFGRTRALSDVGLRVPWGTALALFGPNGAGKSTLLRILATLSSPDDGDIRVAGLDQRKEPGKVRATIGYLGHQSLLYDDLSAAENLHFYARLYSVPDAASRVGELLADVGLADRADQRARTLSNGMRKRLSLARALLHRPSVLLLDEPETGLDQAGVDLLERVVRGVAEAGACVAFTTHDVERGLALADRVAVLAAGRLVIDQATDGLDPATVRAHLGSSGGGTGTSRRREAS